MAFQRGRDLQQASTSGARLLSGQLGRAVLRLRKAGGMSVADLADRSGVPKSGISEIERNETNPTLATIWRLATALSVPIEQILTADEDPFIERSSRADTPVLVSEDGKVRLVILGWIKTVEWLQWYDLVADPGGVLESGAHQAGSVECLSVAEGAFEVDVGGVVQRARAGETLRYRCDRPHTVRCLPGAPGRAWMVVILKARAMEPSRTAP